MNCTYKTNCFGMSLLNIMGTTALGTSIFINFVFISRETEEDYLWAIKELKMVMQNKNICDPFVVITDQELALINSLTDIFSSMKNLLCEWHISRAILVYIKRKMFFEFWIRGKAKRLMMRSY
jgi:hypothetical protein